MKLFTALENENTDVNSDNSLEENLLIQTDEVNSLIESQRMQRDAADVGETLLKIEKANDPEKGLEIAKEHLLNSIGYNKSYSLESFNTDLEANLNIAQEGFFGRVGNAFKRAFTTNRALADKTRKALDDLKNNGSRNSIIVDPPWSKYLIAKSSKTITGKDVVAYFNSRNINKNMTEVISVLDKIADVYTDIAAQISKGTFVTSDSTIEELRKIVKDADPVLRRVSRVINDFNSISNSRNSDNYPDYEPVQYKDVSNLTNDIIKTFSYDYEISSKYGSAADALNDNIIKRMTSVKTTLLDVDTSDIVLAKTVTNQVDDMINKVLEVMTYNARVAYALVRYIEDSTNK